MLDIIFFLPFLLPLVAFVLALAKVAIYLFKDNN